MSTGKGRLDGWAHRTEQWIKLARNQEKKFSERLSEVLASRTQENKIKVSKFILGNFFPIAFF